MVPWRPPFPSFRPGSDPNRVLIRSIRRLICRGPVGGHLAGGGQRRECTPHSANSRRCLVELVQLMACRECWCCCAGWQDDGHVDQAHGLPARHRRCRALIRRRTGMPIRICPFCLPSAWSPSLSGPCLLSLMLAGYWLAARVHGEAGPLPSQRPRREDCCRSGFLRFRPCALPVIAC